LINILAGRAKITTFRGLIKRRNYGNF